MPQNQAPLHPKRSLSERDVPVLVGGAAGSAPALPRMRTGAAGVLVGFGGGAASPTRRALGIHAAVASAISDAAPARPDYLGESGGRYGPVVAAGGGGPAGGMGQGPALGGDCGVARPAPARGPAA
ncbi:GuaB3 family IMP dehydrogenase-related protein, partial [Rothia kristinae]